jgi:hypothetical protein
MPRLRNLILAGVALVAVGVMTVPAEANHRGRGFRAPHHHHHRMYRPPHHMYHYHPHFHGPRYGYGFHGPRPYHYRAPAVIYPYGPRPGVGIGVWGPGGGIHFGF